MTPEAKKLSPVNRSRLHEEIVGQIQKRILSGAFKPGDKLPAEREVAAELEVNRATVREALKKLEVLGLVEIRHGDGIYVKNFYESGNLELFKNILYLEGTISPDILSGVLQMRGIVVPEMAFDAARNRTKAELDELRKIVAAEEADLSLLEKDLALHHLVARASKNLLYVFMLNFFNQIFRDYGFLYFEREENRQKSRQFHRDILAALEKGEEEKARRIMRAILEYTEKAIYAYYNTQQKPHQG
mgnify:FL=1